MAPASNEKIPVSWAALTRLGAGYRFHTEVYGVGARSRRPPGTAISSSRGSATRLSSTADLDRLAATIRGRGIRSGHRADPRRRVVLRREARRAPVGSSTSSAARRRPLSALVVDRAAGWPALSPPLLAARAFRDALVRRGVTVAGRPGLGIAPATAISLASDVSDPLAAIVQRMNHESDNFYAEMLLKQLRGG